jgi:hypothetical protein
MPRKHVIIGRKKKPIILAIPTKVVEPIIKVTRQPIKPIRIPL